TTTCHGRSTPSFERVSFSISGSLTTGPAASAVAEKVPFAEPANTFAVSCDGCQVIKKANIRPPQFKQEPGGANQTCRVPLGPCCHVDRKSCPETSRSWASSGRPMNLLSHQRMPQLHWHQDARCCRAA